MIRSKVLDMNDLIRNDFTKANNIFCAHFGNNWPEVPLRRWEYCAAAIFSGVITSPAIALDAGCGSSIFPKFLNRIGCEVYAIDPTISSNDAEGVHYRKRSMTDIGVFDGYFDYVFAISSIEHVNAGKFAIKGMPFDTGDTDAMLELCRVLKPGGALVLTTDYADRYHVPPGLWPSGSHRIYDFKSIAQRLTGPAHSQYGMAFNGEVSLDLDGIDLKQLEPVGYDYTAAILTLQRPK